MAPRSVRILATGSQVLYQDLGRPGFAHLGVPRSGAADRGALMMANQLLGNAPTAAALECLWGGLSLQTHAPLDICVTGAPAPTMVGDYLIPYAMRFPVFPGDIVTLGYPPHGLRTYLAVRGGFEPDPVLGSRSSCTLSSLGPAPVRVGDRISVGNAPTETTPLTFLSLGNYPPPSPALLLGTPGPRLSRVPGFSCTQDTWVVLNDSDRIGVRLGRLSPPVTIPSPPRTQSSSSTSSPRAPVSPSRSGIWPSEPLAHGSVQVTPAEELVCFLADHPTTGGYPVVWMLEESAVNLLAQLRPGTEVRFQTSPLIPRK